MAQHPIAHWILPNELGGGHLDGSTTTEGEPAKFRHWLFDMFLNGNTISRGFVINEWFAFSVVSMYTLLSPGFMSESFAASNARNGSLRMPFGLDCTAFGVVFGTCITAGIFVNIHPEDEVKVHIFGGWVKVTHCIHHIVIAKQVWEAHPTGWCTDWIDSGQINRIVYCMSFFLVTF